MAPQSTRLAKYIDRIDFGHWENHWLKEINERLSRDKITATKVVCDKSTIALTDATWKKALEKQGLQLANWMQNKEVF